MSLKNNYYINKKYEQFNLRFLETQKIIQKYPDRVPIYIQNNKNFKYNIYKKKYLVPIDFTIGQFLIVLRQYIEISSTEALILYVDHSTILSLNTNINNAYYRFKNSDGFLYIKIANENVFG
jgi:GABA(A) receptor-associated protein